MFQSITRSNVRRNRRFRKFRKVNRRALKTRRNTIEERIVRQSIITGCFPFYQHDVQWSSYASIPSTQQCLTFCYPGTGSSQRGSDQRPFLLSTFASLFIHQAISQTYRYRLVCVTLHSPWDFSSNLLSPDFFVNDFTSTTLWDNPVLQTQDQGLIRFNCWRDSHFVIDTLNGNCPVITQINLKIPATQMVYNFNDTDSTNTVRGAQVMFLITDAPTGSASYFYDLSMDRKFKCIK